MSGGWSVCPSGPVERVASARPYVFMFRVDGRVMAKREVPGGRLGERMAQAMAWEEAKDGRSVQAYGPGVRTTSLEGLMNILERRKQAADIAAGYGVIV